MIETKYYFEDKKPSAKEGVLIDSWCDYVYEGDTIYIKSNSAIFTSIISRGLNNSVPIRLSGFDAPEMGEKVDHGDLAQHFYIEQAEERARWINSEMGAFSATRFLTDLIEKEDVLLDIRTTTNEYGDIVAKRDSWNRAVGIVYVKDKDTDKWINVNRSLLKNGLGTLSYLEDMNISDNEKNEWRMDELAAAYYKNEEDIREHSKDVRDDFLGYFDPATNIRIGDTVLPIQPRNIQVSKTNSSDPIPILRSNSSMLSSSGHHNQQVTITFYFDGKEHIDGVKKESDVTLPNDITPFYYINGLRGLIAQFKLTPFLPIENDNLNEEFDISAITLQNFVVNNVPDFPHVYEVTLTALEFNHKAYIDTLSPFSKIFDWDLFRFYYQRLLEGVETSFDDIKIPFYNESNDELTFQVASMLKLQEKEDSVNDLRNLLRDDHIELVDGDSLEEKIMHDYKMIETALAQRDKANELIEEYNINVEDINDLDTETWQAFYDDYLAFCANPDNNPVIDTHNLLWTEWVNLGEPKANSVIYYRPFDNMQRAFSINEQNYDPTFKIRIRSESNNTLVNDIIKNLVDAYTISEDYNHYIIGENNQFIETLITYKNLFTPVTASTYRSMHSSIDGHGDTALGDTGDTYIFPDNIIEVFSDSIINQGQKRENDRERIINQAKNDEWPGDFFEDVALSDTIVEDVAVSMSNQVNVVPVNMQTKPTHQYMGGKQAMINVTLKTNNPYDLHILNSTVDHTKAMQLRYNNIIDRPIMNLKNNIIDVFGFYGVHFQSIETNTVEGFPGVYQVSLNFMGVYKAPEDFETLSRIDTKEKKESLVREKQGVLDFSKGVSSSSSESDVDNYINIKKHWDKISLYPDLYLPKHNELPVDSVMYDSEDESYVDPDFYALNIDSMFVENTINVLFENNYTFTGMDASGQPATSFELNNVGQILSEDSSLQISDMESRLEEYRQLERDIFLDQGGREMLEKIKNHLGVRSTKKEYLDSDIMNYFVSRQKINLREDRKASNSILDTIRTIDDSLKHSHYSPDNPDNAYGINLDGVISLARQNQIERNTFLPNWLTTKSTSNMFSNNQNNIIGLYMASNWHQIIQEESSNSISNRMNLSGRLMFPIYSPVAENLVARYEDGSYIDDISNISEAKYVGHFDFDVDFFSGDFVSLMQEVYQYFETDTHSANHYSMDEVKIRMSKEPQFAAAVLKMLTYKNYMKYINVMDTLEYTMQGSHLSRSTYQRALAEFDEHNNDSKPTQVRALLENIQGFLEPIVTIISLCNLAGFELEDIANGQAEGMLTSFKNNLDKLDAETGLDSDHISSLPLLVQRIASIFASLQDTVAQKKILELEEARREEMGLPIDLHTQEERQHRIAEYDEKIQQAHEDIYLTQKALNPDNLVLRDKKERYLDAYHDMLNYDQRGRLLRAFPTFYMMFVDEGKDIFLWKLQDIFYEYNGIQSIEVVRSKENVADACQIMLSNRKQNLSDPTGGYKYKRENYQNSAYDTLRAVSELAGDFINPKSDYNLEKEKRDETVTSVQLQTGARIHLRIGYGSSPNSLPILFNGIITELELGDEITLIAQSDGTELNRPITAGPKEHSSSGITEGSLWRNLSTSKDIIADQLCAKEKFREELISKISANFNGGEPTIYNNNKNNIQHMGAAFRPTFFNQMPRHPNGFDGHYYGYEIMQNIYDANIDPHINAPHFTTFLYGMSTHDLLQTCSMVVPNYIATTHPFGLRNTIFYGHPSFDLAYDYEKNEYGDISESVKTFRQMHVYGSYFDIISNQIIVSERDIKTVAVPSMTKSGGDTKEIATVYLDANIFPDKQKKIYVDTTVRAPNKLSWVANLVTKDMEEEAASNYAVSTLKQHIQTMYGGNLIVIGDPTVKPYDYAYMADLENQMNGSFEVNTVVHSINLQDGFTTNITPDPVVSAQKGFTKELDFWLMGKKNFSQYYVPALTSRMITNTVYSLITQQTMPSLTKLYGFGTVNFAKNMGLRVGRFGHSSVIKTKDFMSWLATTLDDGHLMFKNQFIQETSKTIGGKMASAGKYLNVKYTGFKSGVIKAIGHSQSLAQYNFTPGRVAKSFAPTQMKVQNFLKSILSFTMKTTKGVAKVLSGPVGIILIMAIEYIVFSNIREFFNNMRDNRNTLTIMPLQHHGEPFVAGIEGHQGALIGDDPSKLDEFLNHPVFNFLFGASEQYQVRQLLADQYDIETSVNKGLAKSYMDMAGNTLINNYDTVRSNVITGEDDNQYIQRRMQDEIIEVQAFHNPIDADVKELYSIDSPRVVFGNSVDTPVQAIDQGNVVSNTAGSLVIEHQNGFVSEYENLRSIQPLYDLNTYNGDRRSQSEFIFAIKDHAIRMEREHGIPAPAIIAMAAHETGFNIRGPVDMYDGRISYNMFGIKWHGNTNYDYITAMTEEVINGVRIEKEDTFRIFDSYYHSVLGYAEFLFENPRYSDCLDQTSPGNVMDPKDFVTCLYSKGYATDTSTNANEKDYDEKIHSLIDQYDLENIYSKKTPIFKGANVVGRQHLGYANDYFIFKLKKDGQYVDPLLFVDYANRLDISDMSEEKWLNTIEQYSSLGYREANDGLLDKKWNIRKSFSATIEDILSDIFSSQRYIWQPDEIKIFNPTVPDYPDNITEFERRALATKGGVFVGFDVSSASNYTHEEYILEFLEVLSIYGINKISVYDNGVYFNDRRAIISRVTGNNYSLQNYHSTLPDDGPGGAFEFFTFSE